jgi:hypothetical protein
VPVAICGPNAARPDRLWGTSSRSFRIVGKERSAGSGSAKVSEYLGDELLGHVKGTRCFRRNGTVQKPRNSEQQ